MAAENEEIKEQDVVSTEETVEETEQKYPVNVL